MTRPDEEDIPIGETDPRDKLKPRPRPLEEEPLDGPFEPRKPERD